MASPDVVKLIADNLPALTHSGTGKPIVLPLPMFRSSGIPADQADAFAQDAGLPHADIVTLVAEAIVELLEANGVPPTPRAQIEQLQAIAANSGGTGAQELDFYCGGADHALLFSASVVAAGSNKVTISPHLLRVIQQLSPDCALAHRAVTP